jgi:hypothetical protein
MAAREDQVRENRLRRMAQRQGLKMVKSRRRDERALDYGGYMLLDVDTGGANVGGVPRPYSASLDEIEGYLTGEGG